MQDEDVLAVARSAMVRYGSEAAGKMDERAEAHREAGESQGAAYWARVAEAVRMLMRGHS